MTDAQKIRHLEAELEKQKEITQLCRVGWDNARQGWLNERERREAAESKLEPAFSPITEADRLRYKALAES